MPEVSVVISAYNANPAYLAVQLESILRQSVPVCAHVRDDGSPDADSKRALEAFVGRERVSIEFGENLGFEAGFMAALRGAPAADYYAFADQDDEWTPDRAERAIAMLEAEGAKDSAEPVLYCSRMVFCDAQLHPIAHQSAHPYMATFENSLVEASVPGMVMFFNGAMRELLLKADPSRIAGHDWLAYMIATGAGTVLIDTGETVLKRQHESNVSAGYVPPHKLFLFRVKRFLLGDGLVRLRTQYGEMLERFGKLLPADDRWILEQFALPNSVIKALRKLTWRKRYRPKLADEIAVRLMFLIGKL